MLAGFAIGLVLIGWSTGKASWSMDLRSLGRARRFRRRPGGARHAFCGSACRAAGVRQDAVLAVRGTGDAPPRLPVPAEPAWLLRRRRPGGRVDFARINSPAEAGFSRRLLAPTRFSHRVVVCDQLADALPDGNPLGFESSVSRVRTGIGEDNQFSPRQLILARGGRRPQPGCATTNAPPRSASGGQGLRQRRNQRLDR